MEVNLKISKWFLKLNGYTAWVPFGKTIYCTEEAYLPIYNVLKDIEKGNFSFSKNIEKSYVILTLHELKHILQIKQKGWLNYFFINFVDILILFKPHHKRRLEIEANEFAERYKNQSPHLIKIYINLIYDK